MKIRYRDASGKLLATDKARGRSKVTSEIYDEKTGKRIGTTVPGYFTESKKLARAAMPKIAAKPAKRYTPRKTPKPLPPVYVESDFDDDPDEDTLDELEDQWTELFEDDWGELDSMDDLEDLLADDDDWYTHE